jgi:hypothetical protein
LILKSKPLSRKSNLVVQEVNGEVLIYDLNNAKAFCLNSTSAVVWQACNGERSITEINDFVSEQLNSPVNDDLIWLALDQLKEENLIENKAELKSKFEGLSRREVIRKVAITSLAAIPVLMSITAPVAAQTSSACAQGTGRPNGCTCLNNGNCASGNCVQNPAGAGKICA